MKKYILTALKGFGMGAANTIPGVSGGTIAFLTGIYEELVSSISSINTTAVRLLFKGEFRALWKHIHGSFLLSLAIGIGVSIITIAKLMTYLLSTYPIQVCAFFFGLIIASSIFILKEIQNWKPLDGVTLAIGAAIGVLLCTLTPAQTPDALWFIFLCGAIAICTMILPGISGSFVLLILGKYEYILALLDKIVSGAACTADFAALGVFALGAIVGILAFSHLLNWALKHYYKPVLLFLAGFILGSLLRLWPWSNVDALAASAQTPASEAVAQNLHIPGAILFALLGFALVTALELLSKKK